MTQTSRLADISPRKFRENVAVIRLQDYSTIRLHNSFLLNYNNK